MKSLLGLFLELKEPKLSHKLVKIACYDGIVTLVANFRFCGRSNVIYHKKHPQDFLCNYLGISEIKLLVCWKKKNPNI